LRNSALQETFLRRLRLTPRLLAFRVFRLHSCALVCARWAFGPDPRKAWDRLDLVANVRTVLFAICLFRGEGAIVPRLGVHFQGFRYRSWRRSSARSAGSPETRGFDFRPADSREIITMGQPKAKVALVT